MHTRTSTSEKRRRGPRPSAGSQRRSRFFAGGGFLFDSGCLCGCCFAFDCIFVCFFLKREYLFLFLFLCLFLFLYLFL